MAIESTFSCVLCNGNKAELIVRETDGRTIVRCCNCSLCCVHPFPSEEALNSIYQKADYFEAHVGTQIGYSIYKVGPLIASKVEQDRLHELARLHPQRGTLLDVGCAFGRFLLLAGKAGWQPLGVELSAPAVKIARESGLDVIGGTLQTADLPDASVDVVTLWEVIEHVRSPLDELGQIARILKPGGVVALSTPNAASLRARQEGPDWYGYHVSREHLLFFTPQTLTFALKSAGFRISHIRTRKVDPSFRRIFGKNTSVATAVSQSHPGISKPAPVLQSAPIQALIRLKEMALSPLEMAGLGHTLEVYAVKVS